MRIVLLISISLCLLSGHLLAQVQTWGAWNLRGHLGVQLAIGTHVQRLGLSVGLYAHRQQLQLNQELRVHYNLKALGPPIIYGECISSTGIVFAYGGPRPFANPFLSSVSSQGFYRNCVAYAYNIYFNRIGTFQTTGTVHLQVASLSLITENDILGQPGVDKFRTGAVLLQYQHRDQVQIAVNCTAWTGRFGRKRIFSDSSWCYMDTVGGKFTSYSHGMLSGRARFVLPYSQFMQAAIGVDAEQVRNALQNELLHALFNRKNCHMPLLDDKGQIFLHPTEQRIRKKRFYSGIETNAPLFY